MVLRQPAGLSNKVCFYVGAKWPKLICQSDRGERSTVRETGLTVFNDGASSTGYTVATNAAHFIFFSEMKPKLTTKAQTLEHADPVREWRALPGSDR